MAMNQQLTYYYQHDESTYLVTCPVVYIVVLYVFFILWQINSLSPSLYRLKN